MTVYTGRHAELYDLFYAEKPYAAEAAFVGDCLRRQGVKDGRLLELACGTGRHALEFSQQGYAVTATDYSKDMVARARERSDEAGAAIDFQVADMRRLDSAGGTFDAAVCLFDSVGYVQTNEAVLEVFRGVRRCLKPGGVFVFEFWHAPAMLQNYDPVRVRRWHTAGSEIVRVSQSQLDVARGLCEVNYDILELHPQGTYTRIKETHVNRYFLVPEMAALVEAAGLAPVTWCAGFSFDETITDDIWHVVAVVRVAGE